MLKKYVPKFIVNWITISGVALIAVGTLLTYIGQNTNNRVDDKHLYQSIGEKSSQIDKLVKSKSELLARIDKYQKTVLVWIFCKTKSYNISFSSACHL